MGYTWLTRLVGMLRSEQRVEMIIAGGEKRREVK
jgi:hypothetical protein